METQKTYYDSETESVAKKPNLTLFRQVCILCFNRAVSIRANRKLRYIELTLRHTLHGRIEWFARRTQAATHLVFSQPVTYPPPCLSEGPCMYQVYFMHTPKCMVVCRSLRNPGNQHLMGIFYRNVAWAIGIRAMLWCSLGPGWSF